MLPGLILLLSLEGNTAISQEDDDLPPPQPIRIAGHPGTTVQLPTFGVAIDAAGLLDFKAVQDPGGRLHAQRIAAAQAALPQNVLRGVGMRKVSLNRLAAAVRKNRTGGEPPDEMMLNLAGLQRLHFAFFLPASGDIVIAGPAEGWVDNGLGRSVGIASGRPVLQLTDLVVALRAYPPGRRDRPFVGCTIDPTAEGLARLRQFQQSVPRTIAQRDRARMAHQMAAGLRQSLGMANVRVFGISPKTQFAHVLVEADYRMKLIGIGLEPPPVKMVTFLGALGSVNESALQRWWFVPQYDCIKVTQDGLGMELVGQGVQLLGEDKVIGPAGKLLDSQAKPNRASELFTGSFTAKYAQIAAVSPVYAQLRNLIDMLVAAAFIQQQDFYGRADWQASTLLNEQTLPVESEPVPRQVPCAVNAVWKGSRLYSPAGGGVSIQAHRALEPNHIMADEDGKLRRRHERVGTSLPDDIWWWD